MKNLIKKVFEILPKTPFFIYSRNYLSYFANYGYFPTKKNMRYLHDYLFFLKNSPSATKYGYFIDKDTVKRFIKVYVGEKYVTSSLGVYEKIDDLKDFCIHDKYVVKPTHMAGRIIIKNGGKLNEKELKTAQKWLKQNYGKMAREYCYMDLNPKIIVEPFVSMNGRIPTDYKLFIVNGRCEMIQLNEDRFGEHKLYLYDRNWNKLDVEIMDPTSNDVAPKPAELEEMIQIAEKIGVLFPFVRIDLYLTDYGIRFGELTFIPGSGLPLFKPRDFEAELYNKMDPAYLV